MPGIRCGDLFGAHFRYNLLIKDGPEAGRPPGFPLHAHVVPRYPGDLAQDQVFQLLDAWTPVPGVVNTSVYGWAPSTDWPESGLPD